MKVRNLLFGLFASAAVFAACEKEEQALGTPDISISENEMHFDIAGGEKTLTITASRDWKVVADVDWLRVSPESGKASSKPQTVTISAFANDAEGALNRSYSLKFTINDIKSKYLAVSQDGPGGSADALVAYSNDFDVTKAQNNSGWPYLDSNYDLWDNKKGTGSETVTYEFGGKMSVRTSGKLSNDGDYSHYDGSGMNKIFFGAATSIFKIQNITLDPSKVNYVLSFGGQRYTQDDASNIFSFDEFKVYLSNDAQKWTPVTMSFPEDSDLDGDWNLASAAVTLPAGTESLSIAFVCTKSSAYSIDDVLLEVGTEAGQTIDFTAGEEIGGTTGGGTGTPDIGDLPEGTGEGTEANPYDAAKATKVASTLADGETKAGVYVKGIVKSFKDVSGIAQYGNISYYITDADGVANFYVFRGKYLNGANFTSEDQLKIGDEVVVYGDLTNYMGNTPELASGNYIVSLNSSTGGGEGGGEVTPPAEKPETWTKATVKEFLAAAEDETWYELTGQLINVANEQYGNLTIEDETGELYVYGLTKDFAASKNDQSYSSIGLTLGDYVTLVAQRGSYNGAPQAVNAFYLSHEDGELDLGDSFDFTKVTAAPSDWTGDYLIMMYDGKAHAAVSGKDFAAVSDVLTDNGGVISAPMPYAVTVEKSGSNYAIKLPDGKYLAASASANQAVASATPVELNVEFTDKGVKITDVAANKILYSNYSNPTQGPYYRFYAAKNQNGYDLPVFYKK